jgi:hypothetical protein
MVALQPLFFGGVLLDIWSLLRPSSAPSFVDMVRDGGKSLDVDLGPDPRRSKGKAPMEPSTSSLG